MGRADLDFSNCGDAHAACDAVHLIHTPPHHNLCHDASPGSGSGRAACRIQRGSSPREQGGRGIRWARTLPHDLYQALATSQPPRQDLWIPSPLDPLAFGGKCLSPSSPVFRCRRLLPSWTSSSSWPHRRGGRPREPRAGGAAVRLVGSASSIKNEKGLIRTPRVPNLI